MLVSLQVKNLALIDESQIFLSNGLNIFSGETGAGKSLVIGSVSLGLGGKAAKDVERDKNKPAEIELVFTVESEEEKAKLKEMEITNIKGPYAIAKFKEIGRATLEEDEGVISLFEDYFGDASKDKMKEIFDEYESSTETRNADRFSSYEMWKFVKDKVSRDVISLESLVKVLS